MLFVFFQRCPFTKKRTWKQNETVMMHLSTLGKKWQIHAKLAPLFIPSYSWTTQTLVIRITEARFFLSKYQDCVKKPLGSKGLMVDNASRIYGWSATNPISSSSPLWFSSHPTPILPPFLARRSQERCVLSKHCLCHSSFLPFILSAQSCQVLDVAMKPISQYICPLISFSPICMWAAASLLVPPGLFPKKMWIWQPCGLPTPALHFGSLEWFTSQRFAGRGWKRTRLLPCNSVAVWPSHFPFFQLSNIDLRRRKWRGNGDWISTKAKYIWCN